MDQEVYDFLLRHLKSVQENDISAYRETTAQTSRFTSGGSHQIALMVCRSMNS